MKKVLISGLMIAVAFVAGAETVTNNLDVQDGFVYNHGFINPGSVTNGYTFTNAGIRDLTISAGQLGGVDPETGAAITNKDNLILIKAQSAESVTDIVAASNIVAGGMFVGDGSGLINLNLDSFGGTLNVQSMPTSGVWNVSELTISNPVLAGQIQVDGTNLTVSTNLTVAGKISGDGSGLTGVPAGGNNGELQFNDNGVLSGNPNYYIHPETGKLSFDVSPEGNLFRAYRDGIISNENLICSLRTENGLSVARFLDNTVEKIRLSGTGDAIIAGDLQVGGILSGDGSGLVNLPQTAFTNGIFIGENQVLYSSVENEIDTVFVGIGAGQNSTNTDAVFVGVNAGQNNTGESAVFVGEDAGQYNTGSFAAGLGEDAGRYNTGDYTLMLMRDAGWANSGDYGVLLGQLAGRNNSGDYAHLIGKSAGFNNTGTNVLFVGRYAGRNNTGNRVIGLGKNVGMNNTADDRLFIDMNNSSTNTLIYGEFDNNLVRINGDLDVTGSLTVTPQGGLSMGSYTNGLSQ